MTDIVDRLFGRATSQDLGAGNPLEVNQDLPPDSPEDPTGESKKKTKLKRSREGNPGEATEEGFTENLWAGSAAEAFAKWFKATYGANWRMR